MQQDLILARDTVEALLCLGATLGTAESCTGGLIAKMITDVAGSSAVFSGALVTYTNEAKCKLLGVSPSLIEQESEVSYACAEAMAQGARRALGVTFALSTTGYAGPAGGTEKDPVGTVYLALDTPTGTVSERFSAPPESTRQEVRFLAAHRALTLLAEHLAQA